LASATFRLLRLISHAKTEIFTMPPALQRLFA
jgi:hypothetical protein